MIILKSKKLSPMTGKNIETQVHGSNSRKLFFAARSFCQKFMFFYFLEYLS